MNNLLLNISKVTNTVLKKNSITDTLNLCLSDIAKGQQIDSCSVFKNKTTNGKTTFYYVNKRQGHKTKPKIESFNLNNLTYDTYPELYDILSKNKPLHGLVRDNKNVFFKKHMETQGIRSYLFTPVFSNTTFWGWISYTICKEERKWEEEQIKTLQTVAKNIGDRLYKDKINIKLKKTLERFDFYMAGSNQAMWEWDIKTKKTTYSHNWEGMLGYTEDDFIKDKELWQKSIHSEDMIQVAIDLEYFITQKLNRYEGTARMIHKDGHIIWIKYSGILKKNKKGKPIKVIGTHTDISEIKEKENQLELSEAKFRFIAENTTDIICQQKMDGSYYYISNSSKEIIGYTPDELINKKIFDYIHPDDYVEMLNYYKAFLKSSKNKTVTYRFRKKDNTYIWLETSLKKILNHENIIIGIQTSSRDVSDRIKASEEIKIAFEKEKELNEMKSRFVTMASHQFRTPLTVIYSNAELIELKLDHFDKHTHQFLEKKTFRIKNEVDRMIELMNNILIFGKYESEKIQKTIKVLDFNTFINSLLNLYFNNQHHKRKIQVKIKGKKHFFFTDEILMTHILTNLINNAFKYSKGKSDPLLLITYLEKELEIEVIDYGIGIPENDIQYVFTSFFRASNTTAITGSGLGLAVVKQFTDFLNGKIELKTQENIGTRIKLIFPYEKK
ncbi:PAS domain S-box protein [Flavobacterium sp. RSP49]|uniref:sensor histidine kinase n=1 Tax=Flavobacterium sp. RSP49 TaxID=2497487 RepID=UPI000F83631B|nr:PAS domain-containing protein [Flavobacterium sp. RSP49]RTZ02860.1 PAS domain S-box protein [Flavobacterium sp. RSP49]